MLFSNKFNWLQCNSTNNNSNSIDLRAEKIPPISERVSEFNVKCFYKKFIESCQKPNFSEQDLINIMGIFLFESISKPYIEAIYSKLGDVKFSVNNFSLISKDNKTLKGLYTKYGEIDNLAVISDNKLNKNIIAISSVKSNLSKTSRNVEVRALENIFTMYTNAQYYLGSNNIKNNQATSLTNEQLTEIDKIINPLNSDKIPCIYIRAFNKIRDAEKKFNQLDVGYALKKYNSILIQYESWDTILFALAEKYQEISNVINFLQSKNILVNTKQEKQNRL